MSEGVRYALLVRTCLEVLREAGGRMHGREVLAEVAQRVDLTEAERRTHKSGAAAWNVAARFHTGDAATAGWMVKRDGFWWITDDGRRALETYQDPDSLSAEIGRRHREVFRSRKQARKKYESKLHTIAAALALVPDGSWTAYDDLADLVDGSPDEIAHLLAETYVENSHRVLQADGQVPPAMHQHFRYRGGDVRAQLVEEGVEFEGRQANPEQRITADLLGKRQAEAETTTPETTSRRAWLVRGSNVDGVDLVPQWLAQGWVSLAASQLPELDDDIEQQRLQQIVEEEYRHKSYSVREKLLGYFGAFLRKMRPGDYLMTMHRGEVYLGHVDGAAYFVESPDRRSNLRRPVRWLNVGGPRDLTDLTGPLPALTQSQDDLIDLTDALDALDRLYADLVPEQPVPQPAPEARLAEVTDRTAVDLLTDLGWLSDLRELLAERRQVILFGPPGTGKTYLAQKLAARLTEPHAVKLIQFHPSYTYEDFFEGFRPESGDDGTLRFKLTSGPLRQLADDAREHPSTAYILIIDEINRGNLAKIFGELYFLLEYRDQRIRLQYSAEDFTLPANLYLIGTMNTADRSIALVDAAMRRRFAFVELHPAKLPVHGLLNRWLDQKGLASDAPALLDALNARLADADYAIGPSYLMRESVHVRPDGLDRVWRHDILPLLVEHHYADDVDVTQHYGLDTLRQSLPEVP
ncbi:5-methylcytosine-specific restriction enzyme B [Micromonospora nigra]|uniref:5-methylcytosine-specific restriction enzyme B n=1 Tax=Micromonospora nigra TaxID=145857 RepID=A0A1C6RGD1_9ACTN|nr:AAA family ATPase [Micromonospora nigra]SCL16205.1 5-methylcytosine-specific restriction enzyme B [Micromonospora nigra]